MLTFTDALWPGATVTLGELNVAVFAPTRYEKLNGYTAPAAVDGPVPMVLTSERSYVTGVEPPLLTVSCADPPLPSPSEIFDGVTHAGVSAAPTICARPAPCRHVGSRPAVGATLTPFGNAVFINSVRTIPGAMFLFFACRSSAARPATCGDAIDVPEMVLWPPNCWCGQVEEICPP